MIGRTLNHYQIESGLGAGGMGEVYVARDTRLNRQVALKVLPAELAADAQYRGRFQREAEAVAALNHPGIVTIHSVEEADGVHFLTMELIAGNSLDRLITGRGLDHEQFFEIAVQVAEAVAAAHARGITHRDLKPQNIVVGSDGRVKVLDFGLAKIDSVAPLEDVADQATAAPLTQRGALMGTVGYMSPEQATGAPVDRRSDIFSLGVILYEMATGQRPFAGDSSAEQLSSLLRDQPRALAEIDASLPRAAAAIIERCLAKDPDARPATAADLRDALVAARAAPPAATAGPGARTRWGLAAVVVALVVVALVVVRSGGGGGGSAVTSGPAAPAPPAPPGAPAGAGIGAAGRPAIAVMRFDLHGTDVDQGWLSAGAADMLVTGLAETRGLEVVGSDRLRRAAEQLGAAGLDVLERGRFGQVARHAGAGAMVLGSIFALGQDFRIDVRVEDLSSGRVLSAASVAGAELFPLIDELTGKVRASLQIDADGADDVGEVTTRSLEAFRRYSEGREAQRNMRVNDALGLLREAVAIDPAFAMAHFQLSLIEPDSDDRRRHFDLVVEHLDRLPERQRLQFECRRASLAKEPERAEAIAEELIAKYPDEEEGYTYLAQLHRGAGRPEAALEVYQRGVTALPTSGPMRNNLGYALLSADRQDEAIATFEEYARLSPREPNPHDSMGEAYLSTERPREALAAYARALAIDPSFIASYVGRIRALTMLGDYAAALVEVEKLGQVPDRRANPLDPYIQQSASVLARLGRYREVDRLLVEHRRVNSDRPEARFLCQLMQALLALERTDATAASAAFAGARASLGEITEARRSGYTAILEVLVGTTAARAGDLERARGHAATVAGLADAAPAAVESWGRFLEAEILLAAGDLDGAAAAFAAAEPDSRRDGDGGTVFFADWRARIASARGDVAAELDAYRDLVRVGPHRKWTMRLEPRFLLAIARLLERQGDTAGARAEAGRLAEIWRHADDLPQVREARRLAGR